MILPGIAKANELQLLEKHEKSKTELICSKQFNLDFIGLDMSFCLTPEQAMETYLVRADQ